MSQSSLAAVAIESPRRHERIFWPGRIQSSSNKLQAMISTKTACLPGTCSPLGRARAARRRQAIKQSPAGLNRASASSRWPHPFSWSVRPEGQPDLALRESALSLAPGVGPPDDVLVRFCAIRRGDPAPGRQKLETERGPEPCDEVGDPIEARMGAWALLQEGDGSVLPGSRLCRRIAHRLGFPSGGPGRGRVLRAGLGVRIKYPASNHTVRK